MEAKFTLQKRGDPLTWSLPTLLALLTCHLLGYPVPVGAGLNALILYITFYMFSSESQSGFSIFRLSFSKTKREWYFNHAFLSAFVTAVVYPSRLAIFLTLLYSPIIKFLYHKTRSFIYR